MRWNWRRPLLGSSLWCAALVEVGWPLGSNLFELPALRPRLKMAHEVSMCYPSPARKRGSRAPPEHWGPRFPLSQG
jgi:hypothetical protein